MKLKNIVLDICICACFAIFCYSAYQIISFQIEMRKLEKEQQEVEEIILQNAEESTTLEARFSSETYDELKKMNDDYVGYIEFEKQLLSLPIVQANDNDYYLRRSFKRKYSNQGTPFLDNRNQLTDHNMTIYGHYVYADASKMFTPLTNLKNQSFYEENKYLNIFLRNEVRCYVVTYVYEHDYTKTDYDYTKRNFNSEKDIMAFLAYPKKHTLIDSNVDIEFGDSFITLQTCVRNKATKRLIVVAKQIDTYPLS